MNQTLRVAILIASLLTISPAQQQNENRGVDRFAASVSEFRGVCLVRDKGGTKTRQIKTGDRFQAGQQLQCEPQAYLKIRFRSSGAEKEITAVDPFWYQVPNVAASIPKEDGPRLAGRGKGDLPPTAATAAETVARQNVPLEGRVRKVQEEELDVADLYWKTRQKYFLIVAASETPGIVSNLAFTKVDAERVSVALTEAGYEKLGILEGPQATRENFVEALKGLWKLPRTAIVVVYYSGHASPDAPKTDLWLQLYGQKHYGDQQGLSLSGIVTAARGGGAYQGELSIILDTCYSGVVTSQLSLKEAAGTVILASSADYQPSYSMTLPDGVEMSAFTYFLLQALGPDWEEADSDHDGIIFYGDLQRYITHNLIRAQVVAQVMEPRLLDNPTAWVAYDPQHARNRETPARKTLLERRAREIQNPEEAINELGSIVPPKADAYLKALHAIKAKRFEAADQLLETAEREGRVSPVVVFWARGIAKERLGDEAGAYLWHEKAWAALNERSLKNIDLTLATALANVNVGNWIRTKNLLHGVLELSGAGNDTNQTVIASLFSLAYFDVIEGNPGEAELYLRRLKGLDPKILDLDSGGTMTELVDVMIDMVTNRRGSAKRRLEALRNSVATKSETEQDILRKFDQTLTVLLGAADTTPADAGKTPDKLREWSKLLDNHNSNGLVSLLHQLRAAAWQSQSMADSLRSTEVSALLVRTLEFANQGAVETEMPGGESQSILERSSLMTAVADIYVQRDDAGEAEKLLKKVISLADDEQLGLNVVFESRFKLSSLYNDKGRFIDSENLLTQSLAKLRKSLGEQNIYAYGTYKGLADLYERWDRPDDAERSYRSLVRITESKPIDIFDSLSKESFGRFLVKQGKYEEGATLLEQVISRWEPLQKTAPWLVGGELGDDYFELAQSYSHLKRYDAAETTFRKAFELASSADDPDLNRQCYILVWQWFTADSLKKPNESGRFYQELIRLSQADLSRPKPDESFGSTLDDVAGWFRDSKEFSKADELLRLALAIQKKAYGEENVETAYIWESMGDLDIARGRYRNAIVSLKTVQGLYEKQATPPLADLSYVFYRIGFANYSQLDFEQARLQLKRSLAMVEDNPEAKRKDNYSRDQLASVERLLGHYEEAKKVLQPYLDETNDSLSSRRRRLFAQLELTSISRLQGDGKGANEWWNRAQLESEKFDPAEIENNWSLFHHQKAMIAWLNGKNKEAAQLMAIAVQKAERNAEWDQPLFIEYLDDYALILRKQGKNKEAVSIEQRAMQIREKIKNEK
jgi:hypothetical protein